ncbi:MAG: response regulator [Helicobacteraceae bacterium]|jgi:putative two-component system response regulator|nr:response regulator [Helicobacteraceae bacterium]
MCDTRFTIMVVDDNVANLRIAKNALSDLFDVFTVPSAAKMFDLLTRNLPKLILLDVEMPEMSGYEAIEILKSKPETSHIPVIFLTARGDPDDELRGLSLGAIDYISKPFMPQLLRKRVDLHLTVEEQTNMLENQATKLEAQSAELMRFNRDLQKMVEEKTGKVLELQNAILRTVADLVENRDEVTGGHVERTRHNVKALIDEMKAQNVYEDQTRDWDINLLLESSQLHDVGKICISDAILKKPGPLTTEEFEEMKRHAALGVSIIERLETETTDSEFLEYAKIFAGTHHEKWNGTGYPNGLVGEDIPLIGRLMALADVYDALVSERPYKKPMSRESAFRVIVAGSGTHFDPALTRIFQNAASNFVSVENPKKKTR